MTTSTTRSLGGKLNQSSGSLNPTRSFASMILILCLPAAILSSSVHFGTKIVTATWGCLASPIANSLLKVDRPPLEDFHSSAKSVICNFLPDITMEMFI